MSLARVLGMVASGSTEALRVVSAAAGAATVAVASLSRADRAPMPRRAGRLSSMLPSIRAGGYHQPPAPAGQDGAPWTPARLQHILRRDLRGDQIIVVANREPRIHEWDAGGRVRVRRPASGVVTALEPVLQACSGVWIAHGSGAADRATADSRGRLDVRLDTGSFRLRRIWLADEEERGYYEGFANEGLWPLCHLAHVVPEFRRSDWAQYRIVNERFADAVCEEAACDAPIVLVQDYHFALVPALVRERLPRATIVTFWHVPWPVPDLLARCPYRTALLGGLLGSSIVGFQTPQDCRSFFEAVEASLEARVDRDNRMVVHRGHTTAVRAYPISIEWRDGQSGALASAAACRREELVRHRLAADTRLIVGVDRLDYIKGIEERLRAFEHFLASGSELSHRAVLLQVAVPSRTAIARYQQLGQRIRELVARINERYGREGRPAVILIERECGPDEVVRLYRAADVCAVGGRHDGMNLVAKEFVAARGDEQGVLVLSRFAGAARELTESLIVNPYDIETVADAFAAALAMPAHEQRERMRVLREQVARHNVYRWAGSQLMDARRFRQQERLRRPIEPRRPALPVTG